MTGHSSRRADELRAADPADLVMPFDAAFVADPGAGWDRLREAGAVHRIRTPDGPAAWLVTRYAEVHAALLDPRLSVAKVRARGDDFKGFTLPAALDGHILNRDGADHARLRRLVAPAMSQHRIDRLRAGVSARCEGLLADITRDGTGHQPVDLVARLAIPLPLAVVCATCSASPSGDTRRCRSGRGTCWPRSRPAPPARGTR